MNIANQISIKNKTYLLVLLSVVVALILSFVSNNGLNAIRGDLDDLILATKIERYTNKLIHEEQQYRLNANGSVTNFTVANEAYNRSIKYVDELFQILDQEKDLSKSKLLLSNLEKTRQSTEKYKDLYLKGVMLLTELNKQANILVAEGEYITLQIQQYVESKRIEIKQDMTQTTIEKINNGSNIWQYTYVTRLEEKKYRLSPDEAIFDAFEKDYEFMMSEWQRLKKMSDQSFEFEKLEKFYISAEKYNNAMLLWAKLNKQLVSEVLPKMKQLGSSVINSAIQSAENSILHVSEKRNTIALTLFTVTIITIVLGILFGAMIARSISSIVLSFQTGLLNFFQYLNHQKKTAQPIIVQGNDEISVMADVVNENIIKIQNFINRKADYQQALLEWAKVDYQDEHITINKATELSAKALHVERVSIWLFNDDHSQLQCVDLFLSATNEHESGAVLTAEQYPEYFKTLNAGEIMVVDRAREDARTQEFNDSYLKPLNISSMLDLPIVQDNQVIGVICHEKVGEIKTWELDEQEFSSSVVNAISLSQEIKKRRLAQEELKAQKEKFHYRAHHDDLTDLPNRVLFHDRLKQAIKQAQRDDTKIAVLFLDLDHFKHINDTMGHKVGDELLVAVTKRLKSTIRQTDTLARLSGDEFAIVLNQFSHSDTVADVTQSLLNVMNAPFELFGQSFFITLSIGIVVYPNDGGTPEELLKHADTAMYKAKDEGRNSYQFYTHDMTEKAFERIAMEVNFRHALTNEEFIVHYQPQVDAETGMYIGMEALVRWMHPEMGLISPDKFLPFAYDTGLIIPMDQWVMKTAMTQIAKWYHSGLEPGKLSLNVSMRHLQEQNILQDIQNSLQETGCQPEWLELELTEGHIMKDASLSIKILNNIKQLGISLAIDDFGTGYSSLSQLKRLPIDKLKIDRSFIHELPHDDEDVMISKTVIALSKNMGLSVVAEGVETEAQKDFLLSNGCHYIQGYYYSKPLLAKDIKEKLLQQIKS